VKEFMGGRKGYGTATERRTWENTLFIKKEKKPAKNPIARGKKD